MSNLDLVGKGFLGNGIAGRTGASSRLGGTEIKGSMGTGLLFAVDNAPRPPGAGALLFSTPTGTGFFSTLAELAEGVPRLDGVRTLLSAVPALVLLCISPES